MKLPEGSGRWILLAIIVIPIAVMRIARSLESAEDQLRSRIQYALDALEERKPRRITRLLMRDFIDVETNYGRAEVRDWSRSLMVPGERYRATLHGPDEDGVDGFRIVARSEEGERPVTATIEVRCLIEHGFKGGELSPWWDLEFTALMVRDGGEWRMARTEKVNHERRPR